MKNLMWAFLIASVMSTIIGYAIIYCIIDAVDNVDSRYEKELGTKVINGKDTLTVVDYKLVDKTFTLSDGSKVSSKLIMGKKNPEIINSNKNQ